MNNNSEFMPVECLNVPKVLFYDKQYEDLSMDAKLIYALLLDRKEMAIPCKSWNYGGATITGAFVSLP